MDIIICLLGNPKRPDTRNIPDRLSTALSNLKRIKALRLGFNGRRITEDGMMNLALRFGIILYYPSYKAIFGYRRAIYGSNRLYRELFRLWKLNLEGKGGGNGF